MLEYTNTDNSHIGNMLASREGILQGCGGCSPAVNSGPTAAGNGKGIVQARGLQRPAKGGAKRRLKSKKSRKKPKRSRKRGGAPEGSQTARQMARRSQQGTRSMVKRGRGGGRRRRRRRGGGIGYGMSKAGARQAAEDHMGYGSTPETAYRSCGVNPPFKMGAGQPYDSMAALQKGAGKQATTKVDNNLSNAGYGYKGGDVKLFAGSYAPVSSTSYEQTCQRGGKSRAQIMLSNLGAPFGAAKEKVEGVLRNLAQTSQASKILYPPQAGGRRGRRRRKRPSTRKRRKKRRRHTRRRRPARRRSRRRRRVRPRRRKRRTRGGKQRGGYAQYHSNLPFTSTQSLPNGPAGGDWIGQLATPPTYARINDCQNNYNHYTGTNSPSSVFDGAAPPVPALGGP